MTESDPIPSSPGNLPESPRTNGGKSTTSNEVRLKVPTCDSRWNNKFICGD